MIPFARSSLKCSSESIAHVGNLTHPAGNADDALAIDPALATSMAPAKTCDDFGETLLPAD
jgi:hypothetical protein